MKSDDHDESKEKIMMVSKGKGNLSSLLIISLLLFGIYAVHGVKLSGFIWQCFQENYVAHLQAMNKDDYLVFVLTTSKIWNGMMLE